MRTKKIILNSIGEIIPYIIISILYFIRVPILIEKLGSEYNGYFQLINNLIAYLFLAEVGFTQAVIYKLYNPVAKKNIKKISEIFMGSQYIYRKISMVMILLIFILTGSLYFLIPSKDVLTVMILLFLISFAQIIPYLFYSKTYFSLLSANQEKYIFSFSSGLVTFVFTIISIVIIVVTRSLIMLAIVLFLQKVFEEIVIYYVCMKKYDFIDKESKKDISAFKMTKDLVVHSIGELAVNNVDPIVIVKFLGAATLSVYSSYSYIVLFLRNVLIKITSGVSNSLGNIFVLENKKRSFKLFNQYKKFNLILSLIFIIPFTIMCRYFINLWIGKPEYVLSFLSVILFASILFLQSIARPYYFANSSNGLFKHSKYHAFIVTVINLTISIILLKPLGINGLLIGTLIGFVVSLSLRVYLTFKRVFTNESILKEYIFVIKSILLFIVLVIIIYYFESYIIKTSPSIIYFLLYGGSIFLLISVVFIGLGYMLSNDTKEVLTKIFISLRRKNE